MTTPYHRVFAASVVVLAAAAAAEAQDGSLQAPGTAQGPMVVERVHNGFAIMPEVKITNFAGSSGTLAGVSGGWLIDNTLLIGAGGYWLANYSASRKLA